MKPLEILAALPAFAKAEPDSIIGSPAFSMRCRLGDAVVSVRPADIAPASDDILPLSVTFGDEPHALGIARSPRFPELDKIWDARADVPAPILLALVERECGPLLQMLENAVRKQLRLIGVMSGEGLEVPKAGSLALELFNSPTLQPPSPPILRFTLTRSDAVVSAFGVLRNIDLAHESIRSVNLPCECEYAAVAVAESDFAALEPGDAVLMPELGESSPTLVVDGRFAIDGNGVSPYPGDALAHVREAVTREISLGEVFDATEGNPPKVEGLKADARNPPLRLMFRGQTVATGRLDRVGGQLALIIG